MTPTLLDIHSVSLTFPGVERPILSNITYAVQTGDFVIVLGSNGSGKSSLLKLIDQRYQPSSGKINLDGKLLTSYRDKSFHCAVKTLTQNYHESLFTSLTVLENYLLIRQQYEPNLLAIKTQHESEFLQTYLSQFNTNLSSKLNQIVDQLSGGEKQALALALTVLYPPRILLLDEHTSALDPKSAEQLMSMTQQITEKYHITCILTTHDLAIAEQYGNRILALRNGKIHHRIENDKKQDFNQENLLAACY